MKFTNNPQNATFNLPSNGEAVEITTVCRDRVRGIPPATLPLSHDTINPESFTGMKGAISDVLNSEDVDLEWDADGDDDTESQLQQEIIRLTEYSDALNKCIDHLNDTADQFIEPDSAIPFSHGLYMAIGHLSDNLKTVNRTLLQAESSN